MTAHPLHPLQPNRGPADQAAALRDLAARARKSQPQTASPLCPVVCVCSGKGGVGKTMIAANLALALTQQAAAPILIDADIGTPNADLVLGIPAPRRMDHLDAALTPASIASVIVKTQDGLRLLPGVAGGTWITDRSVDAARLLLRSASEIAPRPEVIIVDAGAGIGPTVLNFAALADLTVVVVTPDPTSIADAYAMIKSAHRASAAVRTRPWVPAIVVNQALTPHEAAHARDRVALCAQRFLGVSPIDLGWIPACDHARAAVRHRSPLVASRAESVSKTALHHLAERVSHELRLSDNRDSPLVRAARFLRSFTGPARSARLNAR